MWETDADASHLDSQARGAAPAAVSYSCLFWLQLIFGMNLIYSQINQPPNVTFDFLPFLSCSQG